jgi:hypothetical protein
MHLLIIYIVTYKVIKYAQRVIQTYEVAESCIEKADYKVNFPDKTGE